MTTSLRWLGQNLGTLFLAFILAVVVWISAVVSRDPNVERNIPRMITIEQVGKADDLLIIGDLASQVRVMVKAPESIYNRLIIAPNSIEATIDLTGYGPGVHSIPVQVRVSPDVERVTRITQVEPATVQVRLEQLISKEVPVDLNIIGNLPQGYRRGEAVVEPSVVTISGPESRVLQVVQGDVRLDISNSRESRQISLQVNPVDSNGDTINGVTVRPREVEVVQPISLEGGFKLVIVKVVTTGNVLPGYRLTNISVSPPTVMAFSTDPNLLNAIPYVETRALNLDGLTDDIEVRKELNLPSGVSLVNEQSVLVQVSVAAIEGSITLTVPVESNGLDTSYQAVISPNTVDLIIEGPLPLLSKLDQASFRVLVDLEGLTPGVYQIAPEIDLVPDQVTVQTVLPETVEVTIEPAPASGTGAVGDPPASSHLGGTGLQTSGRKYAQASSRLSRPA
jgi:YbbR domain-containing protein